jgi:competence ComEA-like helix-hairpin-helix protein
MPKIRPPKFLSRLPKLRLPVLTGPEKGALGILFSLLAAGAALRAWERSGVAIGPVDDWDSLRELVIRAPKPRGLYPCAEIPEDPFVKTGTKTTRKRAAPDKKSGPARPIDLNAANETQLTSLPGVGASTAKAIVAYRAAQGKFAAPEDLMNVKGIGPKKFEALRKFVWVKGSDAPKTRADGDSGLPVK